MPEGSFGSSELPEAAQGRDAMLDGREAMYPPPIVATFTATGSVFRPTAQRIAHGGPISAPPSDGAGEG